ncbi:hypothetical protein TcasGA2_TC005082 [Tribolium castaneum]|uniref:RING-type domain-containing protein n=1 Tax=Tribolium castaneum TaxID=7070 RepID=D2CG07_TRICA|nr:hypothetical protein TcasGA2_TC005082 [Tribolium castaneum]
MAAVNKAQIMAAMECPVCYDILRPPIHPCNQGHQICGDCRQQMERLSQNVCCPLCRSGYSLPPSHIFFEEKQLKKFRYRLSTLSVTKPSPKQNGSCKQSTDNGGNGMPCVLRHSAPPNPPLQPRTPNLRRLSATDGKAEPKCVLSALSERIFLASISHFGGNLRQPEGQL